jgi:DnaJ-class molecular chaperone
MAVIIISTFLFGCSLSKENVTTIKKTEVNSVTIVDPSLNGITKTLSKQQNLDLFIELNIDWLKVTTISRSGHRTKETTEYYRPEALQKFSTGDWNNDRQAKECPACSGIGKISCPACKFKSESSVCPRCSTKEAEGTLQCEDCKGTGTVK